MLFKYAAFSRIFQFLKHELQEKAPFEREAPMFWTRKIQKSDQAVLRSLRFKSTIPKSFKTEAPQLLHKIVEQMREIACFAVLIYGSSQLGNLIHCTLSLELHRKVTIKLNANQRNLRKWCMLLGWLPGPYV